MQARLNLFTKILLLVVLMLIPITGLYFYSNKTSTAVLEHELNQSNMNQLIFFEQQMSAILSPLTIWPDLLMQDPDVASLRFLGPEEEGYLSLDVIQIIKRVQTKLRIFESSADWRSSLVVHSPSLGRAISVNGVWESGGKWSDDIDRSDWQAFKRGEDGFTFYLRAALPYISQVRVSDPQLVIELTFDSDNIAALLDQFKSDGRRDPLYYHRDLGVVYNKSADKKLANQMIALLEQTDLQQAESRRVELGGEQYAVNMVYSSITGWYLIDYLPISEILQPIDRMNILFYAAIVCLLIMAAFTTYFLYAGVQLPLKNLVQSFHRLKMGDYSVRLAPKGKGEFSFVFHRFNSMVEQVQELFERVYMEKLRTREARLKQLQAQINPHFFYNCLSYITSMAKLEEHKAVVAMAENLSRYYRYTTRQERDFVPLSEEISFVKSYLEIQKLRKNVVYSIEVNPALTQVAVPLLLLQPLVENAVVHGTEQIDESGIIRIWSELKDDWLWLHVEDNGKGMTEEVRSRLEQQLEATLTEEMGCGLWNVHQRIQHLHGAEAGVQLASSALGGARVSLRWRLDQGTMLDQMRDKRIHEDDK